MLWTGGAYPNDVAELLGKQYRDMKIQRVEDAPDRVVLQSSAAPMPMQLRKVDGAWRLDVSPIIEFRKRSRR